MTTILLVVHLLLALALIGVVLMQRSEGGALGIGGGGMGSLFSSRGAANLLTRATAFLAVGFFITSIALTMLARQTRGRLPCSTRLSRAPAARVSRRKVPGRGQACCRSSQRPASRKCLSGNDNQAQRQPYLPGLSSFINFSFRISVRGLRIDRRTVYPRDPWRGTSS